MNKKQISEIQKVIDSHRKTMFVTCSENCPCWTFQSTIDKWEEKHSESKENE